MRARVARSSKKNPDETTPARLKIMSWNMKALAGEGSDFDRAALVLAQADIVALQEVDLRGQGKGFLNVIGNLIQAKTQQKICRAWVQGAEHSGRRRPRRDRGAVPPARERSIQRAPGESARNIQTGGMA